MSTLKRVTIPLPQIITNKRKDCLDVLVNGTVVSSFPRIEHGTESWSLIARAIEDIQSHIEEEAKKSAVEYHRNKSR